MTASQSTTRIAPRRRTLSHVAANRDLGEQPVAGAGALHRDVGDRDELVGLGERDLAVEQVAEHQRLGFTLGEAAQADRAGRHDRAGLDAGDPGDRQEDRAARRHLDDESEHARLLGAGPEQHDDVAHPADLVAVRIEDDNAGEARDKHPRRRPAHVRRLPPRGPPPGALALTRWSGTSARCAAARLPRRAGRRLNAPTAGGTPQSGLERSTQDAT